VKSRCPTENDVSEITCCPTENDVSEITCCPTENDVSEITCCPTENDVSEITHTWVLWLNARVPHALFDGGTHHVVTLGLQCLLVNK
jgi:hypothetical protein